MTEFQMPMASIPNTKIYINEATMKKILLQNHGTTMNHTKGFSSLFTNVVCDQSNLESSTACSSHKNIAGPSFAPPRKDNFRYHVLKPQMTNEVSQTRVHRMPVDKKIIRTTIMPKIKQEEQFFDPGLSLAPMNANREMRSFSYKERPYYLEMLNHKKRSRVRLDPPTEITGKSFDIKLTSPMRNEWTETSKVNLANIKMEIEKALERCSPKRPQELVAEEVSQQLPQSYMFVEDDRDRFGKQIYPISMPQPFPGPGQYESDITSLNYRLHKIQERSTQKRLVSLWQQQF